MKPNKTVVIREYVFTEGLLKEKLGMNGGIIEMGFLEGRSPADIEQGISKDDEKWFIKTREGDEDE